MGRCRLTTRLTTRSSRRRLRIRWAWKLVRVFLEEVSGFVGEGLRDFEGVVGFGFDAQEAHDVDDGVLGEEGLGRGGNEDVRTALRAGVGGDGAWDVVVEVSALCGRADEFAFVVAH